MRIAAVSDIHSPRYLDEFRANLDECERPDILMLAGDMIEAGRFAEYQKITEVITSSFGSNLPVVACLGNDEFGAEVGMLQEICSGRITFLSGSSSIPSISDQRLGIIGIPPVIQEQPTNENDIEDIFNKRIGDLQNQLERLKQTCDWIVLLMHYSPISPNSFPVAFSWWLSKVFATVKPDLIIHGHVHYATNPETRIGPTRIVNVAFPATRRITEIELV